MSLWNPYAFTILGEPVPQAAPPALRVYGGDATATQLAYAQNAFAAFSTSTRVSFVPNPMEIGRLPDGSTYRITVVGNVATMEMWVAGLPAEEAIESLSGIIFHNRNLVLVNKGKSDAPSGEWRLMDVSGVAFDRGGDPTMQYAEYNRDVFLTGSRSAPSGNLYMLEELGGSYITRYKNPTAFIRTVPGQLVGLTEGGTILKLQRNDKKLQIFASQPVDLKTLFKKFGSPPAESPPGIGFYPRETLSEPGDDVFLGAVAVSKSGRKIAFSRSALSNPYTAADIVDGKAMIPMASRMYVICNNSHVGSRPFGIRDVVDGGASTFLYKTAVLTLNESVRSGDAFGSPAVVKTLQPSRVTPSGKFSATAVSDGIYLYYQGIGFKVSGSSYPRVRLLSAYDFRTPRPDRTTYSATFGASGPITRVASHDEDSSFFLSVGYAGYDSPAVITGESSIRYREDSAGTVSVSFPDGGGEFNPQTQSGPSVGGLAFAGGQGGGPTSIFALNASSAITLDLLTELTLGDGRKLTGEKSTYVESATVANEDYNTSSWLTTRRSADYSTSYTLTKEVRDILLWDPSLDILCYTELLTSVTGEASSHITTTHESSSVSISDYSHTAGPALPAAPQPYLVIECRGRTIRTAIPFFAAHWEESTKTEKLWAMFPNTGVAPGVPALSNNVGSQDVNLGTSGGFYYLGITSATSHTRNTIGLTSADDGDTVVESSLGMRGMSSSLDFPRPDLRYKKTPDTGAAYMTISLDDGAVMSERYVIDSGGIRNADDVVPNLPPKNETIRDWGIF